jgi:hypothetical protein
MISLLGIIPSNEMIDSHLPHTSRPAAIGEPRLPVRCHPRESEDDNGAPVLSSWVNHSVTWYYTNQQIERRTPSWPDLIHGCPVKRMLVTLQNKQCQLYIVMAGLGPAIHDFGGASKDVDCMLASPALVMAEKGTPAGTRDVGGS